MMEKPNQGSERDNMNRTPLFKAKTPDEVAQYADIKGCSLEDCDIYKKTPLHYAVLMTYATDNKVAMALIDRGANVNAQDDFGNTPLDYCKDNVLHQYLVEHGAKLSRDLNSKDVNPKDESHHSLSKDEIDRRLKKYANVLLGAIHCGENRSIKAYIEKIGHNNIDVLNLLVEKNNLEMVEYLLRLGVDVQSSEPLFSAKSIEMIKLLVGHGADVNLKNNKGDTLLSRFAGHKNLREFERRNDFAKLEEDALRSKTDEFIKTDYEIVQYLLEHGADVNIRDSKNRTPSFEADCLDMIKLLVEHGADVNAQMQNGDSLLGQFVYNNKSEIVDYLLEHGADVNIRGIRNQTPLSEAYTLEMIKLLVEHGADVNAHTRAGMTFISSFVKRNKSEIVDYLLEHGADVNIRDDNGETPLFFADDPASIQKLIECGADINAKNILGATPLLKTYHLEKAKKLIELGADIHAVDSKGNNAAYACVSKYISDLLQYMEVPANSSSINPRIYNNSLSIDLEYIQYLREHGVNIECDSINKLCSSPMFGDFTPLHFCNDLKTAQFLIDHGADVNAIATLNTEYLPYYISPLFRIDEATSEMEDECFGAALKDKEMVDLLVKNGARFDFTDDDGRPMRWIMDGNVVVDEVCLDDEE